MGVSILIAVGWTLATLLVMLLLLLLLMLFVPCDLFVRLEPDLAAETYDAPLAGTVRWQLRLRWGRWLFVIQLEGEYGEVRRSDLRLCGIRLRLRPPPKRQRAEAKAKPKRQMAKRKRPPLPGVKVIMAGLEEGARFMARCVSDLGIRITGRATYGFADPAITGWCEGIRWAVVLPVPIDLEADFTRPCLQGWAEAQGRAHGYRMAAAALQILRNPVIRRYLAKQIRFRPLRYVLLRGG